MAASANDNEMQKKAMEFRMLQERGAALQGQVSALKGLIEEAENASKSVSAISAADEKESVLFPLGAGVIVRAKPLDKGKVMLEEGAGVVLEKNTDQAIKQLEERKEKLSKALENYNSELARISDRLEMLRGELVQYR